MAVYVTVVIVFKIHAPTAEQGRNLCWRCLGPVQSKRFLPSTLSLRSDKYVGCGVPWLVDE
jgi:hypothetical protein